METLNKEQHQVAAVKVYQLNGDGSPRGVPFYASIDCRSDVYGYRNPKWKNKLQLKEPATSPCWGYLRHFQPGYAEREKWRVPDNGQPIYDRYFDIGSIVTSYTGSLPVYPPPASLDNLALTRFYSSANSQQTQASGLVFLGELRETVQMLKHPFRTLIKTLEKRELKLRGRWRRAQRVRLQTGRHRNSTFRDLEQAVADTWLETVYGIQPLVKDIEDVATYLQSRAYQSPFEYYPIKGHARTKTVTKTLYWDLFRGDTGARGGSEYFRNVTNELAVRYIGEIKVSPLSSWADWKDLQRLGFSLRQTLPTIWELTPWSMVVDYFADVGGLIDSFNVPLTSIAWFNKTTRGLQKIEWDYTGTSVPLKFQDHVQYSKVLSHTPSITTEKRFDRSGGGGIQLPRPSITFDLPNGKQFTNIVALAVSNSRKRFSTIA